MFQYVCMLNRIARNPGGENMAYAPLRKIIEEMLAEMEEYAGRDPGLRQQFEKIKMPLIFFVDSMIAESRLTLARQWHQNRIAYGMNELAGDEKFYDHLDETLQETGPEADERLAIFYTCLGLGFTGWFAGQHEVLRGKMLAIGRRVPRELLDTQFNLRICPEAYEHLDLRNLVETPALKMATIGIFLGGLLLAAIIIGMYLFQTASSDLATSLDGILEHDLSKQSE
jgi:type VI protein secretion system component VasF